MLFYCIAIIALAIVDGIAGTFDEDAEIGLFSGLLALVAAAAFAGAFVLVANWPAPGTGH